MRFKFAHIFLNGSPKSVTSFYSHQQDLEIPISSVHALDYVLSSLLIFAVSYRKTSESLLFKVAFSSVLSEVSC